MSDYDDFFSDDIVLDETLLAVLDAEETKFNQSQQHPRPSQPVPPPKRQKTDQGWKHTRAASQSDSFYDDLPEISISGDGFYGVLPPTVPNSNRATTPTIQAQPYSRTTSGASSSRSSVPGPSVIPHSQGTRPNPPLRQAPPRHGFVQAPLPPANRNFGRSTSQNSTMSMSRPIVRPVAPTVPTRAQNPSRQPSSDETTALRLQLEQLNKSLEETRQALKLAEDAKFAKEGEVSILRKNIEKTAQEHGANLAKLRAAKEVAESMQAQVQKEMREEIERVRTQFTFKQHEMETTLRKPPWSTRTKKISKDIPPTPLNIGSWNQPDFTRADPSNVKRTPSRPRVGNFIEGSPSRRQASQAPRPSQMFPGFVNAFQPSSPTKSPNSRRLAAVHPAARNEPSVEKIATQALRKISPQSSPMGSHHGSIDIRMDDNAEDTHDLVVNDEMVEELDEVEPVNWAAELHHIIFSHSLPQAKSSTVQTFMALVLPTSSSETDTETFSRATTELWAILSSIPTIDQLPLSYLYSRVSDSLARIAWVLNSVGSIQALTAVLGLLKTLLYLLSAFCGPLLSISDDSQDSRIVSLLSSTIRDHLSPDENFKVTSKMNLKQRQRELDPIRAALAREAIGLFEALCWGAPDGSEARLVPIVRAGRVLDILLDYRQPSWFLNRAIRGLVLFSSRTGLFRHMLSFPPGPGPEKEADYSRIPHIERLCSYLADDSRGGKDAEMARNGILTLISTLSIAHPDARTILLESETLFPALIARLTHLASLLWEDNEELMDSPELANSKSRSLCQTLFLLHDLVFHTQPPPDLKQKIQNANPTSGIDHMFNVTFGRLTYAPDLLWVPDETARCLEQVTETAREILQLVVDGAEEDDMIYAAYQEEEPDDEEMEAMQLEANDL